MARVMHLNKSGSGWSSKTACGRSMLRTPMAIGWEDFKTVSPEYQCENCKESQFFSFMIREDAKKNPAPTPEESETEVFADFEELPGIDFEPVDNPDAWIDADNKFLRK